MMINIKSISIKSILKPWKILKILSKIHLSNYQTWNNHYQHSILSHLIISEKIILPRSPSTVKPSTNSYTVMKRTATSVPLRRGQRTVRLCAVMLQVDCEVIWGYVTSELWGYVRLFYECTGSPASQS